MIDLSSKLQQLISESRKRPLDAIISKDIQGFLNSQPNIKWRPDYLLEDAENNQSFAFTCIYDAEAFTNILSQEVEKAKKNCNFDFFFVLEKEALIDIFEEPCREKGFGVILNKGDLPLLIRDAIQPVTPLQRIQGHVGHYPKWVVDQIVNINLGNSKFRTALKDFSKEYLRLIDKKQLDWEKEEKLVKNTIGEVLRSDNRYISGIDSYDILSRFEGFWHDIRDHYFHSFHIFLLGLLIINRYRKEFINYYKNVFPEYLDHSIEFVWLLTSIFHDVGYPIAKLDDLKKNIYGVSVIPYEKEITNVWNDPVYNENLKQLVSIFKFSYSDKKRRSDWRPEVFGSKWDELDQIFRESFYECHGVAGCFRFLLDIFSEARREEDPEKRTFLINHIYPAALSIALHDRKFRERLAKIGINKIKLSKFPFAILLTYLDSLQEDRRDKYLCIEAPELLLGFKYNGKITAIVDENLAENYPRLGKLKAECRDFIKSMEFNGIIFEYPSILLT